MYQVFFYNRALGKLMDSPEFCRKIKTLASARRYARVKLARFSVRVPHAEIRNARTLNLIERIFRIDPVYPG